MDHMRGNILWSNRKPIILDVDTQDLVDNLYEKDAIDERTYNALRDMRKRATREETTEELIKIVIRKGNNAIDAFVDSLAKDYDWIYRELSEQVAGPVNENIKENADSKSLNEARESVSRGNVPRLPAHYVTRTELEKDVVRNLENLTRHKMLVLYGMPGSGKTSLAIHVLRTHADLITNQFKGHVFWLHLNNCKTEDDIFAQQSLLFRKASDQTGNSISLMTSSMSMSSSGSNFDMSLSSSNLQLARDLKDKLKKQFAGQVLENSLLVLDEVYEKRCVEAFDIGCKMLIITRDSEVVSGLYASIITVPNRLKKEETLKVLASFLEIEESRLPEQARKIHEACKGSPFNVALIGAQLADDREMLLHDNSRWKYYLKKLDKKEFGIFQKPDKIPMKTIEVCIKELGPNEQLLFKKLAVLADDVKVSASVVNRIWNIKLHDTINHLKSFKKKSLLDEYYDPDRKIYLYELHDLIANYLKTCFNEEETKRMHCELLKSYGYGNHPPFEIVDDGYIAFFLGYHIQHTKNVKNLWTLFKLYLNLRFLGNKIRLAGPADVILDLEKYEKYIVDNEPDRNLLYSIKSFVKTHGADLHRYQHTDIVQSIIQNETEGILYQKALEVAENYCAANELYFDFVHERDAEEIKPSIIDVKEPITCVAFLGDYVLVGTPSMNVKLYHVPTNKLVKVQRVSGAAGVRWVGACPALPTVVGALSADGVITLWRVEDGELSDEHDDNVIEEVDEVDSASFPVTIQPKIGPYLNCRWFNHQKTLVTHTTEMIMIYSYDGAVQQVLDKFPKGANIRCCVPCNNDMCVIAAVEHNGNNTIEVIDKNKEKVVIFEETDTVLDITTVPNSNQIITLKSTEITVHEYKMNYPTGNSFHKFKCEEVLSAKDVKENLSFLAIAVNKTGWLLFVATNDSRVICIDLRTNSRAFDLENRRGNVICMAVSEVVWDDFEPGSDVLLTGTDTVENCAKVWNLEPDYVLQNIKRNNNVRLTKKFDVSFESAVGPPTPTSINSNHSAAVTHSPRLRSFGNNRDVKRQLTGTLSLDRYNLKLNLKGISNNNEPSQQPLLAVVDDKNNIQVMRGKKVLTEILTHTNDTITTIKISPCNQYIVYGLKSGAVKKYVLRSKEDSVIMDMYSAVQYLNFVTPTLLIAGSRDCCLMAHRSTPEGWKTDMLQQGNVNLGSEEFINDLNYKGKKRSVMDIGTTAGSQDSLDSRQRVFKVEKNGKTSHRRCCGLLACFWVKDVGLITIQNSAAVHLWDQEMKLVGVLKRSDLCESVTCAAFQKNILVICDGLKPGFLTFQLEQGDSVELKLIQDYSLNTRITACDLTADGNVLALGMDNGDVVIWNVPARRQIRLLKHHTNSVKSCTFSPVPERLYRSSNTPSSPPLHGTDALTTPLVLITLASQIVWWNVTYMLNSNRNRSTYRSRRNVMSPAVTPVPKENKNKSMEAVNRLSTDAENSNCNNVFFGNTLSDSQCVWNSLWKGKKHKEGSKKEEMLSCIKLSGINAKKVCVDDSFSCFVTVDNSGHVSIMNVMKPNKP